MPKKKKILAENVVWDLSDLYKGINDPRIEKDIAWVKNKVKKFNKDYVGKINRKTLTGAYLLKVIKDQEAISHRALNLSLYAFLLHSKNTSSEKIGAFYQRITEFATAVESDLTWLTVEWLKLDDKTAHKVIKNKLLKDYKYFLTHSRSMKPYTLSEKEEVLIKKLGVTGPAAFERLFNMVNTDAKYKLEIKGKVKELTFAELSPIFTEHKDREVRKAATEALYSGLKENEKVYAHTLNTLLLNSKVGNEIRGFEYPQQATFLEDDLSKEIVDAMSSEIQKFYKTSERYYKIKKKLLGNKKLYEWDRYSKIYPNVSGKITWEESVDLVLDSFDKFDKKFANISRKFIESSWVDAPMLEGKMSGAFCAYAGPKIHPYILMNFKGRLVDATTLAHELGHGVHHYLGEKLPLSVYSTSTPVAEVASIFSESLVFDALFEQTKNKKAKINLLADKLQGSFATVFRQNAFHLFEGDTHTHRKEKGEISISEFNDYFQNRLQAMFGKGLTLTKGHANSWMYVMHFYTWDFYVYSYAFGELLTLALYAKYKEDGNFVKNYMECLSLGGSISPVELTKKMGVDITKKEFWAGGLQILDDYVSEFEELTKS